jgi:hypothetical protein
VTHVGVSLIVSDIGFADSNAMQTLEQVAVWFEQPVMK